MRQSCSGCGGVTHSTSLPTEDGLFFHMDDAYVSLASMSSPTLDEHEDEDERDEDVDVDESHTAVSSSRRGVEACMRRHTSASRRGRSVAIEGRYL